MKRGVYLFGGGGGHLLVLLTRLQQVVDPFCQCEYLCAEGTPTW